MKEKNFVSAVVYVRNDEYSIEQFLTNLTEVFERNFEQSEIVCVDDSSVDGSVSIIKQIAKKTKNINISIVNLAHFHGREVAMRAGVDISIGDFIFEFENAFADFDTELVMSAYKKSLSGFDFVKVAPRVKLTFRQRAFYAIFNKFSYAKEKISTQKFSLISRRGLNLAQSLNSYMPYRKALYVNSGLKSETLFYEPKFIKKKKQEDEMELAQTSLMLFTNFGYKSALFMSILMCVLAVFMCGYVGYFFVFHGTIKGWTTTMLFISFGFFGLFSILTIVIKYLQILVELTFKRRHYNVSSIEKLTD